MFYDRFVQICAEHNVSPSKAAIEAGLSKSTVTKWKTTPSAAPTGTALRKLSEYFGISIAELLGEKEKNDNPQPITEEELKVALFGGDSEVTDEMWNEATFAIQLIKERHKKGKDKK